MTPAAAAKATHQGWPSSLVTLAGMVWRDTWVGVPDVVVFSEDLPRKGKLHDVALCLRKGADQHVTLTSKEGRKVVVVIPDEHRSEAAIVTDLDLLVMEETA